MYNYQNLNANQTKEFSRYLLDISKASLIGIIALNTIAIDTISKIVFGILNMFVALICLEKAMKLLEK